MFFNLFSVRAPFRTAHNPGAHKFEGLFNNSLLYALETHKNGAGRIFKLHPTKMHGTAVPIVLWEQMYMQLLGALGYH